MKNIILIASLSLIISCSKQVPVPDKGNGNGERNGKVDTGPAAAPEFIFDRQENLLLAGRLRQSTLTLIHPVIPDTFVAFAAIPVLSANETFPTALDSKKLSIPGRLEAHASIAPEIVKACPTTSVAFARPSDLRDIWYLALTLSGKKADCEKMQRELSKEGFAVVFADAEILSGDKRKEVRLRVFPVRIQNDSYADGAANLDKPGLTATGETTSLPIALPNPAGIPAPSDQALVGVNSLHLTEGITSIRWDSTAEVTLSPSPTECNINNMRLLPLYGGQEAMLLIALEKGALKKEACVNALDRVFANPLKLHFKNLVAALKENDPLGKPALVARKIKEIVLELKPRGRETQPLPAPDSAVHAAYSLANGRTAKGLLPTSCMIEKDPGGGLHLMADFAKDPSMAVSIGLPNVAPSLVGKPLQVHSTVEADWLSVHTGEMMVKKGAAEKETPVLYTNHQMGFAVVNGLFCRVFYYVTPSKKLVGRFDCQDLLRFDPNGSVELVDGNGTFSCQLP